MTGGSEAAVVVGLDTSVLEEAARSSAKPGFVDRLIHARYARLPATLVTFERAARRLAGTTVLR